MVTARTLLHVLVGALLAIGGVWIAAYPQRSYEIRTAWKHEDPDLTGGGRLDQRLMGVLFAVLGLGVAVAGVV